MTTLPLRRFRWYLVIGFAFSLFLPFHTIFAQTETLTTSTQDTSDVLVRLSDEFYRARVTKVVDEEEKEVFDQKVWWQYLDIQIQSGAEKGKEILLIYEIPVESKNTLALEAGDKIVLGKNINPPATYYVSDRYRLGDISIILFFFLVVSVVFAKSHGLRAFVGLALSFFIIFQFLLPAILAGKNPFLACVLATFSIAFFSMYIAHGFNARTTVAVTSTLLTLGLAAFFGYYFVGATHLFGTGTEEAFYLRYNLPGGIDLKGLLLGGILIGTLGVLDDVTTAQAAAVEEIQKANTNFGFRDLYTRGLSVGREHIVSLINTLVLAYTGASFPLLLLFLLNEIPTWVTLNTEIVMEELIRMLVGSVTLVFAVPITTLFAAFYFRKKSSVSLEGDTHH